MVEVPADDPDLRRLVADQFAEVEARYGDIDTHGFVQPPLHPATRWLLLRLPDGTAAGCVGVQPLAHTRPGSPSEVGEIKRLYVVPALRGHGLAQLLMTRAEAVAAAVGYTSLVLETGTRQPEAIALYERTGWEPAPPYGHYKDSPLTRCFRKLLPTSSDVTVLMVENRAPEAR